MTSLSVSKLLPLTQCRERGKRERERERYSTKAPGVDVDITWYASLNMAISSVFATWLMARHSKRKSQKKTKHPTINPFVVAPLQMLPFQICASVTITDFF